MAIADRIRDAYIRERRRLITVKTGLPSDYLPGTHWDGGKTRKGTNRKAIWPRLANEAIKNRLDPDLYVTQSMRILSSRGADPLPNQIFVPAVIDMYRLSLSRLESDLEISFTYMKQVARNRIVELTEATDWSNDVIWKSMLLDDKLQMNALFRYCLARAEKYFDVAKRFADEALREYMIYREFYDRVWKNWIPDKLKKRADRVKNLLRSTDG